MHRGKHHLPADPAPLIKHHIATWHDVERKSALETIASMAEDLKKYASSEKAIPAMVKKREQILLGLARFVDQTTAMVNYIAGNTVAAMDEAYQNGYTAGKLSARPQYDKHGSDKELVRSMSITQAYRDFNL